jgi:nucleoid-associated protein YgaU
MVDKKQLLFIPLSAILLLGGCTFAPLLDLQRTHQTMARAQAAGAPELAPTEYASATSALDDAERLIERRKYKLAVEALQLSRGHARRAIAVSEEVLTRQEVEQKSADQPKDKPRQATKTPRKVVKPEPQPESAIAKAPLPPLPSRYTVGDGETLWLIAARKEVYGEPLLWPLLYRANRDQIRDPRQIYAGQVLDIPRNISSAERRDAIDRANASEIFPVGILLPHPSPKP